MIFVVLMFTTAGLSLSDRSANDGSTAPDGGGAAATGIHKRHTKEKIKNKLAM
jgi:hypothetical protein